MKKTDSANSLKRREISSLALLLLASMAIFFYFASSKLSLIPKIIVMVADLALTGVLVKKILAKNQNVEGYYGLLIIKGLVGFKTMKVIADKYSKQCIELADLGLSLSFGALYSHFLYWRKSRKKFLFHLLLILLFFAWLNSNIIRSPGLGQLYLVVGIIAGLGGVGFVYLITSAFNILTTSNAPAGIAPVIPGVTVPYDAVIAIIIIVMVHELAHGILASIEKLKLKSSGLLLIGFLPVGAFVEPYEEKMAELPIQKKRRILVAGSSSNLLFFLIFLLLSFAVSAVIPFMVAGVTVKSVDSNSSAYGILHEGDRIIAINGEVIRSASEINQFVMRGDFGIAQVQTSEGTKNVRLSEVVVGEVKNGTPAYSILKVGDRILAVNEREINTINDLQDAKDSLQSRMNVSIITQRGLSSLILGNDKQLGVQLKQGLTADFMDMPISGFDWLYSILTYLLFIFTWTFTLNFALATINILPLFITDGQRMVYEELYEHYGEEGKTKAEKLSIAIGVIVLIVLLINLIPHFR